MSEYHEYMTDDERDELDRAIKASMPCAKERNTFRVLVAFMERLREAEEKHPVFAEGPWQGLGFLQEEVGELVRATTHNEGEERMYDEALDVMVTALRFARGDWKMPEEGKEDAQ